MNSAGFCSCLSDLGKSTESDFSIKHLVTIQYQTPDSGWCFSNAVKSIARESRKKYTTKILLFKSIFKWTGKIIKNKTKKPQKQQIKTKQKTYYHEEKNDQLFNRIELVGSERNSGNHGYALHSSTQFVFQMHLGKLWIILDVSPLYALSNKFL